MAFCEDRYILNSLFHKVSDVPWDPITPLPLTIQCLYQCVLDLLDKYKYTARDASAALVIATDVENYDAYFTRKSTVDRIVDDFDKHGTKAILFNIGDLVRILHELDVQYESRMKRLAVEALISQPMIYDSTFRFGSKIADLKTSGALKFLKNPSEATVLDSCHYCKFQSWFPTMDSFVYNYFGNLNAYKGFHQGQQKAFGAEGLVYSWFPLECFSTTLCSYFDRSMFFGPVTRTTQMTCFRFRTLVHGIRLIENEYVVRRDDAALTFTTSMKYLPITRELQYVRCGDSDNLRLVVVCENTSMNCKKIRVSLATSTCSVIWDEIRVTKIEWVDAECMESDRIRYSFCKNGMLEHEDFPYNVRRWYRTWHVVMGNGCRLKVRVSNVSPTSGYVDLSNRYRDPDSTWTVTDTENHAEFAECASMLQRYYGFQARSGKIHPLESTSVTAFIAEYGKTLANLDWLRSARLERPSTTGTPPARYANHHVSRLIHAMVLKELTKNWCYSLEYPRLSSVSSV